jgi:predicted Zn-dependent peptidase
MDRKYFGPIEKGEVLKKQTFIEKPITQTIKATYQDPNIQIPMVVASYRTPSMKTREARVLDFISSYLSDGRSSKLYKKVVDEKEPYK